MHSRQCKAQQCLKEATLLPAGAVMSANERRETVFECIRGGAEDYLLKPVTRKEVQHMWQHVWRRQQANALRVPHLCPEEVCAGAPWAVALCLGEGAADVVCMQLYRLQHGAEHAAAVVAPGAGGRPAGDMRMGILGGPGVLVCLGRTDGAGACGGA